MLVDVSFPERRRYRTEFFDHASISGMIIENNLLMNPDYIMLAEYDFDDHLRNDTMALGPLCRALQKHFPKFITGIVDYKGKGHESLFVSNAQENLRLSFRQRDQDLRVYYTQCLPSGNIKTYWNIAIKILKKLYGYRDSVLEKICIFSFMFVPL